MKRVWIALIILLTTTIVALFVSDCLNKALILGSQSSSSYKTYRLFVKKPEGEIPLLGSSRALGNYVPSLLSPLVFNYGINGSGMYETLFMLREALKNPSPGPVLVNFDPWGFWGEYKPSFVGDYRMALTSETVRDIVPHDYSDCIPGIRFHGQLRKNLTSWIEGWKAVTRKIDQGAALLLNSRTEKEWAHIRSRIDNVPKSVMTGMVVTAPARP